MQKRQNYFCNSFLQIFGGSSGIVTNVQLEKEIKMIVQYRSVVNFLLLYSEFQHFKINIDKKTNLVMGSYFSKILCF